MHENDAEIDDFPFLYAGTSYEPIPLSEQSLLTDLFSSSFHFGNSEDFSAEDQKLAELLNGMSFEQNNVEENLNQFTVSRVVNESMRSRDVSSDDMVYQDSDDNGLVGEIQSSSDELNSLADSLEPLPGSKDWREFDFSSFQFREQSDEFDFDNGTCKEPSAKRRHAK